MFLGIGWVGGYVSVEFLSFCLLLASVSRSLFCSPQIEIFGQKIHAIILSYPPPTSYHERCTMHNPVLMNFFFDSTSSTTESERWTVLRG